MKSDICPIFFLDSIFLIKTCYNIYAIAISWCEPGQDGNVAAISIHLMCDGFFIRRIVWMNI